MRLIFTPDSYGRCGITAIPEYVDAHPALSEFWMDYKPETQDTDRMAVAASLLHGPYADQRLSFEFAISSTVAIAIESYYRATGLRVDPVRYVSATTHSGDHELMLHFGEALQSPDNRLGEARRIGLDLLRSDKYSGSLLQMDRLRLATNAWLHGSLAETSSVISARALRAGIAAALLVANDLGVSAVTAPAGLSLDSTEQGKLRDLIQAVGVKLIFSSE